MDGILPWYGFDKIPAGTKTGRKGAAQRARAEEAGGIVCRSCANRITDRASSTERGGSHTHTRTNPGGFTYRFGCFNDAPGCAVSGPATHEHTWFAGYAWQLAACGRCGEHLGWLFDGADRFFGLILDRLADAGTDGR